MIRETNTNRFKGVIRRVRLIAGEDLAITAVLALLISFHLNGVFRLQLLGAFNISSAMAVTAVVGVLGFVFAKRLSINKHLNLGLLLSSVFLFWIWLEAFRSPLPVKGMSTFLMMGGNIVILAVVGSSISLIKDLSRLNRAVFILGFLMASINFFITFVKMGDLLISTGDFVGILRPPVLRHFMGREGLAGGPSLYSIVGGISLLCGVGLETTYLSRKWKWIGIIVIGVSLLLSSSRAFIVGSFGAAFVFVAVWFFGKFEIRRTLQKILKPLVVLAILLFSVSLIPFPYSGQSIAEYILVDRSQEPDSRLQLWSQSLSGGEGNLWLGEGLRAAQLSLGWFETHNSYVELIVDTGIFGLILWGAFAGFLLWRALQFLASAVVLPWAYGLLVMFVMIFFHSLLYYQFFWLLAAVILGYTRNGKSTIKNKI